MSKNKSSPSCPWQKFILCLWTTSSTMETKSQVKSSSRPLRPPRDQLVFVHFQTCVKGQQSVSLSRNLKPSVFAGGCKQRVKHAVFWKCMTVFFFFWQPIVRCCCFNNTEIFAWVLPSQSDDQYSCQHYASSFVHQSTFFPTVHFWSHIPRRKNLASNLKENSS